MDIPEKVIDRLSLYHFILEDFDSDEKYISSSKIAELLRIDNSQVRKDIKYLDNSGKCRVGYDIKHLKQAIEKCLGFEHKREAYIIGAGNLGSALVKYDSFTNYGLNIVAMFDNDSKKIGQNINGKPVYDIASINEMIKKSEVEIAILTVPKKYAKGIAKIISEAGIKYIWNFTPCILDVPKEIQVWNENLIGSFLQFTNKEDEDK
ncbi:redox-sensing transcriptional repressor Rex [bacterium]|nr:redox-sensing transcriptional repressor Rex [bacterium]